MTKAELFEVSRGDIADRGRIIGTEGVTPRQFGDVLRESLAKSVSATFAEVAALHAAKNAGDRRAAARLAELKRAPWYTCGTYKTNQRCANALLSCTAFVGDADQAGTTRDGLLSALDGLGCAYIAATSFSHGCGGQARYRVIIPFDVPLDPRGYNATWQFMNTKLGGILDPAAKDPTRVNYFPRMPRDAKGHEVIVHD